VITVLTLLKKIKPRIWPYKIAAVGFLMVSALVLGLVYIQFRGGFTPKTPLTMVATRAGLVMDPGSPVTYNGVQIGRVASISEIEHNGRPAAKFVLEVAPKYIKLIPANVEADILATTVFGNKYVSLTSPKNPGPQRITPQHVIDVTSVTTEFNTLFETINDISEKVDPVKLNLTLSAAADALTGLGDKFGQSIVNANAILDDVNPQMPRLRRDIQQLAALGDTYANAAPDLFDFLNNSLTTVGTLRNQQDDLDAALLAAAGFGNTGADIFGHGGPYLQRAVADLVPSTQLLDTYSPELFCALRIAADVSAKSFDVLGGIDGVSLSAIDELVGAPNPYIYPENLPRINAHGGPGGAPGCWQEITHDFWPAPYLVTDTGASVAPYNHYEVGSPYAIEYVWGRQVGDLTINP
jgi:phospholipid/cholesterol/gamma-HCH transport system substrate-binding protein